ncbi:predicted protein [Phaeodactylum tricornutum CCAP 1055/1]|uniref:HhH-GPD domain-containing protein n=1 Tax=Phaeodactylum tricornutum (strain CCAP 1055/1) TaxID=556484 RepID=B5Y412_PHATC|nr:predicted protein [Phaeodactylum tricornutum CCAP 1055/1]ACI65229.1 predicted protein [Phaeodactylum tricornutum CCAP 1055/1]|eukprot:XP_002185759.1 predicted protein [Phaeodactylum tricornutum CCAP 1055/1]
MAIWVHPWIATTTVLCSSSVSSKSARFFLKSDRLALMSMKRRSISPRMAASSASNAVNKLAFLDDLLTESKMVNFTASPGSTGNVLQHNSATSTKAGWCLRQGLLHICTVDEGYAAPLVALHGLPAFYSCVTEATNGACRHDATQDIKDPSTCFESLCRIIAGQFVSGKSAQAVWKRLLEHARHDLTPTRILQLVSQPQGEDIEFGLQKPVGLTKNKAKSIVDLARHFEDGRLSEGFLTSSTSPSGDTDSTITSIQKALLKVQGIGPWSVDMFLLFYLEQPNVLPLGDLGVRKGIAIHFAMRGSVKKGKQAQLCPKQDAPQIRRRLEAYAPYQSLLTYYMWRAADTPSAPDSAATLEGKAKSETNHVPATSIPTEMSATPSRKRKRSSFRTITP